MVKKTGNKQSNGENRDKLDDDLDALFSLPLAEFTAARNALASQLKKGGRSNEAEFVKTLGKPSISAWAVNQLYWRHRDAFDRLIDSGERFRQAQSSSGARKVADMRSALDARRESLSELSDLASDLLREAGHNPTQEFTRRIATTLEAMSAYASQADGPRPGRLTQDVDPPGFESLASFVPSGGKRELTKEPAQKPAAPAPSSKATAIDKSAMRKTEAANDAREREKDRQLAMAAAKASAQEAKRLLAEARTTTQSLEAAHKKAHSEARDAEKERREAERLFIKARTASEDATERVQKIADEVDQARQALEEAKRAVDKTAKELEKLFRSPNK
jgi:DNA repair exonuclease SbcCD ATPase subunit